MFGPCCRGDKILSLLISSIQYHICTYIYVKHIFLQFQCSIQYLVSFFVFVINWSYLFILFNYFAQLSCCKFLPHYFLPREWDNNRSVISIFLQQYFQQYFPTIGQLSVFSFRELKDKYCQRHNRPKG